MRTPGEQQGEGLGRLAGRQDRPLGPIEGPTARRTPSNRPAGHSLGGHSRDAWACACVSHGIRSGRAPLASDLGAGHRGQLQCGTVVQHPDAGRLQVCGKPAQGRRTRLPCQP
jgi:hypothetical protein